jgi:hypothetical protein
MHRSATIRGNYRYKLERVWDVDLPICVWIGLNPSTADGEADDQTIRKMIGFSERWGFGAISVVNLFAFRATDPNDMKTARDPIGPDNDGTLKWELSRGGVQRVVAAWGSHGGFRNRDLAVADLIERYKQCEVVCLGETRGRQPKHPCYLSYDLEPYSWAL